MLIGMYTVSGSLVVESVGGIVSHPERMPRGWERMSTSSVCVGWSVGSSVDVNGAFDTESLSSPPIMLDFLCFDFIGLGEGLRVR